MKFSVSSYSFEEYIRSGKLSQLSAMAVAKDMGFDAIEFTDLRPPNGTTEAAYADLIRAEADRLGLEISAYTVYASLFQPTPEAQAKEIARICDKIDIAKRLGAPLLRHDALWKLGEGQERCFEMILPSIAAGARQVTEYAASLGIRTCTENHGMIAQDSDRMQALVLAVHHPNYGLLLDLGNFSCVDEDPVHAVSRLAPLAFHVHVKDFFRRSFAQGPADGFFQTRGCNYLRGCAVGEGDLPIHQCISVLQQAGYHGFFSLEYEGKEDCLDGIRKGLYHLRSWEASSAQ